MLQIAVTNPAIIAKLYHSYQKLGWFDRYARLNPASHASFCRVDIFFAILRILMETRSAELMPAKRATLTGDAHADWLWFMHLWREKANIRNGWDSHARRTTHLGSMMVKALHHDAKKSLSNSVNTASKRHRQYSNSWCWKHIRLISLKLGYERYTLCRSIRRWSHYPVKLPSR